MAGLKQLVKLFGVRNLRQQNSNYAFKKNYRSLSYVTKEYSKLYTRVDFIIL